MTHNEFNYCRKRDCFIRTLLDKGYVALWPLAVDRETRSGAFLWTFYVQWTEASGSRVRSRYLCEKHHKAVVAAWSQEAQGDLEVEEATEQWLKKTNSQILF